MLMDQKKEKNPFLIIVILLFLVIGLFFVARNLIPQTIIYLTQAARTTNYSLANSYVFGAPLLVDADGQTKIRVSAFLLSNEGRGVSDKQVSLNIVPKSGSQGVPEVIPVQPTTDQFGKAEFEVTSATPGQFVATAVVDGLEVPQTVTLTFR